MGLTGQKPAERIVPSALAGGRTTDPDYLIAALRTHLNQAIGFADLCAQFAPELRDQTRDVVQRDHELFDITSRSILKHSVGD